MIRHLAWLLALWACSGDGGEARDRRKEPGGGAPRPPPVASVKAPVAHVNGVAIDAECVATQARTPATSLRQALDQCIDFELLAQAAAARGRGEHPEVRALGEREAVRALLRAELERAYPDPASIPRTKIEELWRRPELHARYNHPEYRSVVYVRAPVDRRLPRGVPADILAKQAALRVASALGGRRDLPPEEFFAAARAAAGDTRLTEQREPYEHPRHDYAEEPFAAAAFAIPEVGMISEPARTRHGWDVLLLTKILPARSTSLAEAEPELRQEFFPFFRKHEFLRWSGTLGQGLAITVDERWLARIAADGTRVGAQGRP
jgi:hypothetical protein